MSNATLPSLPQVANKSILTPTSGFLASGFTHTINAYQGCAFAASLCGTFCYAQHNIWITHGRPWGLYGVKGQVAEAYCRDYDRLKKRRRGEPRPLRIYMSSSTDPYVPQELKLGVTRRLLELMLERPPDVLVLQTHHTLIKRDLDLIEHLSQLCTLWVSITVETDMDPVPGFPRHASPPSRRLETLRIFRERGIPAQATVSPLLPLADPQSFAEKLDWACDRVIVDHYLIGDGSPGGLRTRRTDLISRLEQAGLESWTSIDRLWEFRVLLDEVLGPSRVLVSREGFNSVAGSGSETDECRKCEP
jgi:DNA repair photolyase